MINQEIYNFIENNIKDHLEGNEEYVADQYVKEGYGQISGGYFVEAYKKDKEIRKSSAEPSQKWHLLHAYYDVKKEDSGDFMQKNVSLGRVMCPQLMLWIAEIAGLDKSILDEAKNRAINYELENSTKNSREIKRKVLNKELHWNEIVQIIREEKSWEGVKERVKDI